MRRKLLVLFLFFICTITISSFFIWNRFEVVLEKRQNRNYAVDLNEVKKQLENGVKSILTAVRLPLECA